MAEKSKNLITLTDHFGKNIEIDLDDLAHTSSYEPSMYYEPAFEARKTYGAKDVHNEYYEAAIPVLLEVVQNLNRRVRELEAKLEATNAQ